MTWTVAIGEQSGGPAYPARVAAAAAQVDLISACRRARRRRWPGSITPTVCLIHAGHSSFLSDPPCSARWVAEPNSPHLSRLDSHRFTLKPVSPTSRHCHSLFMRGYRREFYFPQRLGEKATSAHFSLDGNVGGAYTVALWRLSEKCRYLSPGKTASLWLSSMGR